MVSTTDRKRRLLESRAKICAPARLDDSLCFYCPQDNVDALSHPRVSSWIRWVTTRYVPDVVHGRRNILLLLPCTKRKPYPLSPEHLAINAALIEAGFLPKAGPTLADDFLGEIPPTFRPEVLALGPLHRGRTVLHRAVMSEPLGFVPYESVYRHGGGQSVACSYDDPGLFEGRGNAVSPWRKDFTGVRVSPTRWTWGDGERAAYVTMHNEMSRVLAAVIGRIRPSYDDVIAWVAPGLTHRSFILEHSQRAAHGVPSTRRVDGRNLELRGVNDRLPPGQGIECLPTPQQCAQAKLRLGRRLGRPVSAIGGYYSRGGGDATPLALPELLAFLIRRLERKTAR
jgi:hypothetical protein